MSSQDKIIDVYVSIPAFAGNSVDVVVKNNLYRICVPYIPACAGNSFCASSMRFLITVYPRVRGQLASCSVRYWLHDRISPRTRATPMVDGKKATDEPYIPAYAGNSFIIFLVYVVQSVYPRVRGQLTSDKSLKNRCFISS
jgi:hypothetical protein